MIRRFRRNKRPVMLSTLCFAVIACTLYTLSGSEGPHVSIDIHDVTDKGMTVTPSSESDHQELRSTVIEQSNEKAHSEQVSTRGDFNPRSLSNENSLMLEMRRYIPKTFLEKHSHKNPCWHLDYNKADPQFRKDLKMKYPGMKKLLCVPFVHVIGYPRAGTAKLLQLLSLHPDFIAVNREPASANYLTMEPSIKNISNYIKRFVEATERIKMYPPIRIIGDVAPMTALLKLSSSNSIESSANALSYLYRWLFLTPKMIVILRDPIEVVQSAFYYFYDDVVETSCRRPLEQRPSQLHYLVQSHIQAYNQCVDLHKNDLSCLDFRNYHDWLPKDICGFFSMDYTVYYATLNGWFKHIPRPEILVLSNNELSEDAVDVALRMYQFLDLVKPSERLLSSLESISSERVNQQEFLHMSKSSDSNTVKYQYMLYETVALLKSFYMPFNRKLAQLLRNDNFLFDE